MQKEVRELKFENKELRKTRADAQWVAKTDFDDLKKTLEIKEREIEHLKRQMGK